MAEEIFIRTEDGQGLEALTPELKAARFAGIGELLILAQNPPVKVVYSGEEAERFEEIIQAGRDAVPERPEGASY